MKVFKTILILTSLVLAIIGTFITIRFAILLDTSTIEIYVADYKHYIELLHGLSYYIYAIIVYKLYKIC